MIYVTVGTQKFNFDRMLQYIDKAIELGYITDEVIAQIGYSTYIPRNYKYYKFIDKDKIEDIIDKSKVIVTHGGSGNIIESLKNNKKIIAIPRKSELKEHVDDHQCELVNKLSELKMILKAESEKEFLNQIKEINSFNPNNIADILHNSKKIKLIIDKFIEN